MKPTSLITSAFVLTFLNASLVFGQDDFSKALKYSPFAKGSTFYDLSNDLSFNWKKLSNDDVSAGNKNRTSLHLDATYFLVDNIGVGIGISSKRTREKYDDIDNIQTRTLGSVNAMYGRSLSGILNIYGKAAVRGGWDKYKYDYMGSSEESRYNEFGLNFEVGAPFNFKDESGLLVTPFLAYDYGVSKNDDYKDITSGICLGARLNFSLPCASYAHGCDEIEQFSENKYSKGTNVIGGSTLFSFNLGSKNDKYTGDGTYNYDEKYSNAGARIRAEYFHYIINNVAIGGELRLRTSSEKNKDDDSKQSDFSWMVMPQVLGNFPVKGVMHNTFGFIGYGFGMEKQKETNTETSETKYNTSDLTIGLGHNIFLTEGLSLTPIVDYSMYTQKNSDTDIKSERNGFEANFSIRYTF